MTLLRLPQEVRNLIWEAAVHDLPRVTGLLNTCRQITFEVMAVIFPTRRPGAKIMLDVDIPRAINDKWPLVRARSLDGRMAAPWVVNGPNDVTLPYLRETTIQDMTISLCPPKVGNSYDLYRTLVNIENMFVVLSGILISHITVEIYWMPDVTDAKPENSTGSWPLDVKVDLAVKDVPIRRTVMEVLLSPFEALWAKTDVTVAGIGESWKDNRDFTPTRSALAKAHVDNSGRARLVKVHEEVKNFVREAS